ncbi:hypothetical protein P43SY_005437 [Pythium insidiosum]|uniref:P-type ATPase N-terminal domain-containing protein n=1 Tax=Pythium insidiosum TaxID=114742 RepID=A0AAD5M2I5_PYTIN|nr:hypothetical protein P43SY_005437 [Pythium insidiosum]
MAADGMRVISIDRPARRREALDADALRQCDAGDAVTPWSQLLARIKASAAASRQWQRRRHAAGSASSDPEAFADNVVVTAKYSVFNFAPRVFLAQLRRPSNIYFLFIAVLQSIKEVSNTSGVPTILLPLTIVFICSAIKEALEDRERHRADALTNSREVLALSAMGQWELTQWGDLQVGDIVKVRDGEQMPADLLLLCSEEIDRDDQPTSAQAEGGAVAAGVSHSPRGGTLAYIETKSLDGETNLKIRSAIPCVLRNTTSVTGLVIFTGHETKVFCSNTEPVVKSSSVEQRLNVLIVAAYCNVRFVHRTPVSMSLLEPGSSEPVVYKILNLLEFDSDRKRMSVIIERPDGAIELMCKGADNVILERLAMTSGQAEQVDEVYNQLSIYAKYGMRTLCLAYKRIDRQEYETWNARYAQAHSSMDELVKRRQGLPNAIDPLMNEIEQDLRLLGVTAVQDKLQQGVPQTLEVLQQTSMKVWTLTGDKMETAVNIGQEGTQAVNASDYAIAQFRFLQRLLM